MRQVRWALIMIGAAVGLGGCSPEVECGEFPLDDGQRVCVVETVDEMVDESYPFADYKGVDLDRFSQDLWQLVEDDVERTDEEFLSDLNYVVSTLEDGHTRMERTGLEEDEQTGVAPVGVRRVDDEVVVDRVDTQDHTDLIGERVEAVDGRDAVEAIEAAELRFEPAGPGEVLLTGSRLALAGPAQSDLELTMADGRTVRLSRHVVHDEPEARTYQDGEIGYLRVDTFGFVDDLERLDAALNEVMDTEGLMIDLRGNGGGFPTVSEGLFARLIEEDYPSFEMIDVDGNLHRELEMEPRGETYDGDVALLVDGGTYSASNFFAHRIEYHDRGVMVGDETGGGAASPANSAQLVPGVWFQVSTNVVYDPEGNHAESGFEPAIDVDIEDFEEGDDEVARGLGATGDPVKDRAIRYLEELQ